MAPGPSFRKRTTQGGPPTDLPEQPLIYPGKPLGHRYTPTEKSRRFEEAKSSDQNKLAGTAPFTPVASINFLDKNIHIGPLVNENPRSLTPMALSGRLLLPRRGAGIFELPEEIRRPLEERIGRLSPAAVSPTTGPKTSSMDHPAPNQQAVDTLTTQQPTNTQGVHTELERLKELARQELSKRQSADKTQPVSSPPTTQASTQPVISAEQPSQTVESPIVERTPETQVSQPQTSLPLDSEAAKNSPKPEDETVKLLTEAEKLEAELSQLSSSVSAIQTQGEAVPTPPKPPLAQHPKPTIPLPVEQTRDGHLDRIDQLDSQKSELSKKVSELKTSYEEGLKRIIQLVSEKEELAKKVAELGASIEEQVTRISQLVSDNDSMSKKIIELNSSYTEEKQKRQGAEERIKAISGEFERKLTQAQIERTNLLDQVQKLEKKASDSGQENVANERQLGALKSQLATAEKERDDARAHMKKVDSWVRELGRKTDLHSKPPIQSLKTEEKGEVKEVSKEISKDEQSKARVVKPQLAVGKMAPTLTSAPNVLNGVIKDQKGLLLSNVIIVVKDSNDQPVRALKSNKIGQFAISTPLPNGVYTMEFESPGHSFEIVQVDIEGKVMRPIEIRVEG